MVRTELVAMFALSVVGTSAARAGDVPGTKDFKSCRTIVQSDERLACFDSTADAIFGPDPAIQERRQKARVQDFGRAGGQAEASIDRISAKISAVEENAAYDVAQLVLDNGQVWQTLRQGILRTNFRVGDEVAIEKTALGGYRLRIDGRSGYRSVIRVR